jgi:hypothetical protein
MECIQHFVVPNDIIKIILKYAWNTKLHPILCVLCKYINKWLHTAAYISSIRGYGAWGVPRTIPLLIAAYENGIISRESVHHLVSIVSQSKSSTIRHQPRFIITDDTITTTTAWYYALAFIYDKQYTHLEIRSILNLLSSIGISTYHDCRLLIGVRGLATRISMTITDNTLLGQVIVSPGWLLSPSENVLLVWTDSINKVQKLSRRDLWQRCGNGIPPMWTKHAGDLVTATGYVRDTPNRYNTTYLFEMLLLSTTKWLRGYEYGYRCLYLIKYLEPEDRILRLVLLEILTGEAKYQIDAYVNELCRIYTYQRVSLALGDDIMCYCNSTRIEHNTTL